MRLIQLQSPVRVALFGGAALNGGLPRQLGRASAVVPKILTVDRPRFAAVKAQGAYKLTAKKTLPKKLGAKRIGDQYVLPGTIIYKQRGTLWHPGENTILGRDHTIHAAIAGYVKYYRDYNKHPDRQYIGVTFDRKDTLPYSSQAARKRKLGMVATPRKAHSPQSPISKSGIPIRIIRKEGVVEAVDLEEATVDLDADAVAAAEAAADDTSAPESNGKKNKKETKASRAARRWNAYIRIKRSNRVLYLGKNYSYQESNSQIGRLMGKHKGKTPGTQRYGSRRSVLRHRRTKREAQLQRLRELERQQRSIAPERQGAVTSKKSKDAKKAAK